MNKLTEFQKRALDFNNHLALTANAGSGKTFVLSKRFVKICLETDTKIDSIIAITFTDKAAAELFVKISKEVDEQLSLAEDNLTKKKLLNLRSNLINANISTIHSFCAHILREYASDLGIDSSFSVFDEQQKSVLIESIVNDFVSKKLNIHDEQIKSLIRLLGSVSNAEENLKNVIQSKNVILKLYKQLFSSSSEEVLSYYRMKEEELFIKYFQKDIIHFKNTLNLINNLVSDKGEAGRIKSNVSKILQSIDTSIDLNDFIDVIIKIKHDIITKTNSVKKKGYLNVNEYNKYFTEVSFIEKYIYEFLSAFDPEAKDNQALVDVIKNYYPLFLELIELYELRKQKLNYLDFDDLLTKVEELISDEKVLSALKDKYKYIMIDEFQDTNEIQYNIFMPILDKLRIGNLFIVGDEKQSIYMFRDAELEVFEKTKNEISSFSNKNLIKLPQSFRHSPKIAFFTNQVFLNLFYNPNPFFNETENNNLVCTREDYDIGCIEFLLSKEESFSEADLIADKISFLVLNHNIKLGDIAILSRKRSTFESIEKALLERQISFLTIGGKGFYQQQIIMDINNYLMFLINPQNDLALIGILRSPFFYFNDRDIFLISQSAGDSFFEKLIQAKETKEEFSNVVNLLLENINLADQFSITSLINKVMKESGYFSVLFSRKDYNQDYANYQKLLSLANHFSNVGYKSLFDFTEFIKNSSVNINDEGQAAIPSEVDAVKIMTIHKSKGLQFKVVFLVDTNNKVQSDSVRAKSIVFDKEYGMLLDLPIENYFNKYSKFRIANVYKFRKSKKELAEAKRLLYVGITRAVDYLFISADFKDEKIIPNSFLSFLFDHLKYDPNSPVIKLYGKLPIDKLDGTGINEVDFGLSIAINNFQATEELLKNNETEMKIPQINLKEKIRRVQSGEIISASKINIFNQCPQKYNLIYNIGLDQVMKKLQVQKKILKSSSGIEANVIGSAIHFVLQNDCGNQDLQSLIQSAVNEFIPQVAQEEKTKFIEELELLLKKYLTSDIYKKVISYKNYHNEFQIYIEDGNYYLFGIIDKVVIKDEEIIIIDYKTDIVTNKNRDFKVSNYIYQLKFYAYLALKYFGIKKNIELNLIFIRTPEKSFSQKFSYIDLINFGGEINKIVARIRNRKYEYNFNHCPKCQFLFNENCIALNNSKNIFSKID